MIRLSREVKYSLLVASVPITSRVELEQPDNGHEAEIHVCVPELAEREADNDERQNEYKASESHSVKQRGAFPCALPEVGLCDGMLDAQQTLVDKVPRFW